MMQEAAKQFDELCQIEDVNERISTACSKFSNGELSAKAVRMMFDKLDSIDKIALLDEIYKPNVRKENMRRLPPKILVPNAVYIKNQDDLEAWGTVGKYHLINLYESSKTQDRFIRLKKTIGQYEGGSLSHFSSKAYSDAKKYVDSVAMKGFIDNLMFQEKELDVMPLNLPSLMTLGAEIECINAYKTDILNLEKRLGKYGVDYLENFRVKYDTSVHRLDKEKKLGAEIVTGIMEDTVEDWTKFRNACLFLKAIGCEANRTCGGHIHIGTNTLGVDKKAWEVFLKTWAEAEPLIYMISNRRGEKTRATADHYAGLLYESINCVKWQSVQIKDERDIQILASEISRENRYRGLNLTNVGSYSKNTVEFRLSNGSVDYNVWRENMLLYGRMMQMAKMQSIDPTRKKKEMDAFFEKDIPEKEKIKRFLNLVFDNDGEKEIFYKRWQYRAGEEPIFGWGAAKTYRSQWWKEHDKSESMVAQIATVADSVSDEDRINAMRALIGQKEQNIDQSNAEFN